MGRLSFLAALLLFLTLTTGAAAADGFTWQLLAFPDTRTNALAVSADGTVLYLATELGLYVSEDAGENWLYASYDLDRAGTPPIMSLAVDPRDPRTAYAGTQQGASGGVYVTHDLGLHWQRLYAPRRQDGVRALTIDPADPNVIFASATLDIGVDDEVIASYDGGNAWQILLRASGWHAQKFFAFVVDPSRQMVYGASTQGVVSSKNNGQSWVSSPNPDVVTKGLALAAEGRGLLYANSDRDILVSADGGASWRRSRAPALTVCQVLEPSSLVAGPAGSRALYVATRSLCPNETAKVFALAGANRGQNWVEITAGLPAAEAYDLVPAGGRNGKLYALTSAGLWQAEVPASADVNRARFGGASGEPSRPPADAPTNGPQVPAPQQAAPETADAATEPPSQDADSFPWALPPLLLAVGLGLGLFVRTKWAGARGLWRLADPRSPGRAVFPFSLWPRSHGLRARGRGQG